jgi:peroxiredoxin
MLLHTRSWIVVISAIVAISGTACQSKPSAEWKPAEQGKSLAEAVKEVKEKEKEKEAEKDRQPQQQPAAKPAPKSVAHKPMPQPPLPSPAIAKVVLSNEIRAACLVKVGDAMPEVELPDAAGKLHDLKSLYGQKLTVACFWTIGTTRRSRLVAAAALQDLERDVFHRFGSKAVGVIGINVGDAAAAVGQEAAQAGVNFPNLLDPKGAYFAKVAKDKRMPRVFLLDAKGKVLWFDVELSRDSRWELTQSIRVALGEL